MSGIVVACLFIALLVVAMGAVVKSAVDLAKGDVNRAFRGALKWLVMLSTLTAIFAWCACYENGLAAGLKSLIGGRYALFFWISFPGQIGALAVLVLASIHSRYGIW